MEPATRGETSHMLLALPLSALELTFHIVQRASGKEALALPFRHIKDSHKCETVELDGDFSVATLETLLGVVLSAFGVLYGSQRWLDSLATGQLASSGTVMLAALPIIVGVQLLLSALNYDIQNAPRIPQAAFLGGPTEIE